MIILNADTAHYYWRHYLHRCPWEMFPEMTQLDRKEKQGCQGRHQWVSSQCWVVSVCYSPSDSNNTAFLRLSLLSPSPSVLSPHRGVPWPMLSLLPHVAAFTTVTATRCEWGWILSQATSHLGGLWVWGHSPSGKESNGPTSLGSLPFFPVKIVFSIDIFPIRGDDREEDRSRFLFCFLLLLELNCQCTSLNREPSVSFISQSGKPTFGKSSAVPRLCSKKDILTTNSSYFKGNGLEWLPLVEGKPIYRNCKLHVT